MIFAKLDLRVARVLEFAEHPNADKLLILKLNLGPAAGGGAGAEGGGAEVRRYPRRPAGHYRPEELLGKLVIVVANLEPRNMRGQPSQGMILKAKGPPRPGSAGEQIVVVAPLSDVPPGSPVL